MDHFAILRDKLHSLQWFYGVTTEPFLEIKRRIEANEEPYIARGNPENYSEPPFLSEWMDADEGLKLQQQTCLSLLQRSFREFLDEIVRQHPKSRPKKGGNWFENYRVWFLDELGIDWTKACPSLDRIQELSIARNDVQHGGQKHGGSGDTLDAYALLKRQSLDYHARFPDAFFASEAEKNMWREMKYPQPVAIELTPEKLDKAVKEIIEFAKYIASNLPSWMY